MSESFKIKVEDQGDLNLLRNKKIIDAWFEGLFDKDGTAYDDVPILMLKTEKGELIKIKATYWSYTGQSEDEYPCFITIQREEEKKGEKSG